jgi:transcriptional regulator with AAA-type ATPase domain
LLEGSGGVPPPEPDGGEFNMQTQLQLAELPDAEEERARRYVYSAIDRELGSREWIGTTPPELVPLLHMRFGVDLAKTSRAKNERLEQVVGRVLAACGPPAIETPAARLYIVPWVPALAVLWLKERLASMWPNEAAPFLAEDAPTLLQACLALEAATPRAHAAASDAFRAPPTLIRGPTGTGKELLALAIHLREKGSLSGFGAVNCGALSPNLLESELFGHVKGAFTGATADKKGFVEEHVTIFLDEVGDMPHEIQVRLLRFLNTGEFRPVGSNQNKNCKHVRIIAATHVDLDKRIAAGQFREDLLQRLRGHVISLRGLHERRPSIPIMLTQLLEREAERRSSQTPILTAEASLATFVYGWPGNMREMTYAAEHIASRVKPGGIVRSDDLPEDVRSNYVSSVPNLYRKALELKVADETGTSANAAIHLEYLIKQEVAIANTPRVMGFERMAHLVEHLAKTTGVEDQLGPVAVAMSLTAKIERLRLVQTNWLAATGTFVYGDDAKNLIERVSGDLETQIEQQLALHRKSAASAEQLSKRYALPAIVRAALPFLLGWEGKPLEELEGVVLSLTTPPLNDATRWLVNLFRHRSPSEAKELVLRELSSKAGPAPAPAWENIRNDADKLRAELEKYGSVAKLAEVYEVTTRTVQIANRALGLRSPRARARVKPGARRPIPERASELPKHRIKKPRKR